MPMSISFNTSGNYAIQKLELERILLKEKVEDWRREGKINKSYREAKQALEEIEEAIEKIKS